ncbi:hypothetical protein ES705_45246 [subsurface metagenome]
MIWAHKTKVGRVVYDRPKTMFTACDVARIVRSLDYPFIPGDEKQSRCMFEALTRILLELSVKEYSDFIEELFYMEQIEGLVDALNAFGNRLERSIYDFEFAGGTFGGAGATREF